MGGINGVCMGGREAAIVGGVVVGLAPNREAKGMARREGWVARGRGGRGGFGGRT